MADAFLNNELGDGYEAWEGFYDYHKLGYDGPCSGCGA